MSKMINLLSSDKYMERDIRERDKDPKECGKEKQGENNIEAAAAAGALDETTTIIHEVAIGKGLSGALNLLKDRGALKQTSTSGGRKLDVENNNGVGRTDEYGRILTPKQEFRLFCHKFHGKGPGKKKQQKRILQYQEELKVKHMKNAERMREAQAHLKSPYLVLSGNVKPAAAAPAGQTTSHGFKCKSEPGGNMGKPGAIGPIKKKARISH